MHKNLKMKDNTKQENSGLTKEIAKECMQAITKNKDEELLVKDALNMKCVADGNTDQNLNSDKKENGEISFDFGKYYKKNYQLKSHKNNKTFTIHANEKNNDNKGNLNSKETKKNNYFCKNAFTDNNLKNIERESIKDLNKINFNPQNMQEENKKK
ncbi:hypothetical protein GVAV_001674 [Gurleya vavrai]